MDDKLFRDEISELIYQLKEEIEGGFVTEDEELYVVRQLNPIKAGDQDIYPVIDFFFKEPPLSEELKVMKVIEAKQMCFKLLDNIAEAEDADDLKAAIEIHTSYLKDYTAGNNKRNEKNCFIVHVEGSSFPMMMYFEEDEVSDKLSKITAGDLMKEFEALLNA